MLPSGLFSSNSGCCCKSSLIEISGGCRTTESMIVVSQLGVGFEAFFWASTYSTSKKTIYNEKLFGNHPTS